jgi:hypothetical protein
MVRRALLSEAWWQQATIIPDNEREIAKHYTLDRSDLDLIMRQNKASNESRQGEGARKASCLIQTAVQARRRLCAPFKS